MLETAMSGNDPPSQYELLEECIQALKELQGRLRQLTDRFHSQQNQLDRLSMALARLQAPISWTELTPPEKPVRSKPRPTRSASSRSKGGQRPRGRRTAG